MPNRIIKESICASDSVDKLTWFEEVFFYRLIVNCDDYGRLDARPTILKARLFPLKDGVTVTQVGNALFALTKAGMVQVYMYDQKPFLQLVKWWAHQQIRNKKSKYPSPDDGEPQLPADICKRLKSIDSNCPRNPIQSESNPPLPPQGGKKGKKTPADYSAMLATWDVSPDMRDAVLEWTQYKAQRGQSYVERGFRKLLSEIAAKIKTHGEQAVIDAISHSMARMWAGIVWDKMQAGTAGVGTQFAIGEKDVHGRIWDGTRFRINDGK